MSLRDERHPILIKSRDNSAKIFENFINKQTKTLAEYEKTMAEIYNTRPPEFVCPLTLTPSRTHYCASYKDNAKRTKREIKEVTHVLEDFDSYRSPPSTDKCIIVIDDTDDDVVFLEERTMKKNKT